MDDGVRERHGVVPIENNILLTEYASHIKVAVGQDGMWKNCSVSAVQARYLAGRLRRLARRIDERNAT